MVIRSDMKEHLFSNLDGYAQKIPPNRDVDRGFYFADEERLSEYELKTVEEMPPSLVQSLSNPPDVKISNEERNLRACVCGAREPRTIAEQAIVKLVLQALILGGLDDRLGSSTIHYYETDPAPENDIKHLSSKSLRDFLVSVGKCMMEIKSGAKVIKEHDESAQREFHGDSNFDD